MKWLIVTAAFLAVVSCAGLSVEDLEFHAWKLKFGKSYRTPEEEAQRKDIWLSTRRRVLAHNILADQGIKTYRMGINQFSDMDEQEYRQALHRNLKPSTYKSMVQNINMTSWRTVGAKLPDSINWSAKGCVTPVKNQHMDTCGSCWAFSAVGALESHTCIKRGQHRQPTALSEQQLVDCSVPYGNSGCVSGYVDFAFMYAMNSQGIVPEKSYPYKAKICSCNIPKGFKGEKAHCLYYVQLPGGDELSLQAAVAHAGPVSVNVDASNGSFKHYTSGVYFEPECGNTMYNITHAMLVVGYGTEEGHDYWLVKNSYGTTWGDQGYIKMARNRNNNCAIASYAFYPIVR